jgi:hypothetical protein
MVGAVLSEMEKLPVVVADKPQGSVTVNTIGTAPEHPDETEPFV